MAAARNHNATRTWKLDHALRRNVRPSRRPPSQDRRAGHRNRPRISAQAGPRRRWPTDLSESLPSSK
eukprot:3637687-Pyramimonas_sp.AAC.1